MFFVGYRVALQAEKGGRSCVVCLLLLHLPQTVLVENRCHPRLRMKAEVPQIQNG